MYVNTDISKKLAVSFFKTDLEDGWNKSFRNVGIHLQDCTTSQ
jgi:hypothetical protein